ncbi:hypothetical protein QKU48_gp0625 [Fadolivirus algeromassiliense]|jgi:hypothetical protein|uniref:Uncharacterized protein n=1 Tax=Fadolivirus FV1/VV64 TaxID=3070911 RepID=A0A7D3QUF6_9VIRU|nr:hypothetical protein QKU48_gp0625 [Fadolivirus algeromassiliense]QKF94083.1 hypothetical protein Fadolivirus_1_625 [Fadolivirus FV1/VV64]
MESVKNYLNIGDITNNTIYIDEEFEDTKETLDENSLQNISWVDSVEKELGSSMDSKIFLNSSQNNNEEKCDDINKLITIKYNNLNDLNILEYQTIITNALRKTIKNNDNETINIDDLILKIQWLIDTTKYLSDKVGLNTFTHKETDKNTVARSSYKFCNYNFECEFNYNTKKYTGCFAQHYVHNLVYADLNALLRFILNNKTNITSKVFDEIKKSINTTSFVIGHMYDELKKAQTFKFFNNTDTHIERTPKKKKTKSISNV